MTLLLALALAAAAPPQSAPPVFRAEDVRPHGSARPHPLVPGQLVWIFGRNLARGCAALRGGVR